MSDPNSDLASLQVVAAEYAFVLHTTNPISGAKDEMMGEVCHPTPSVPVGFIRILVFR